MPAWPGRAAPNQEYGTLIANRETQPRNPKLAQDQFLRGVQLLRTGQTAAATSSLLAAIQSDDRHFEAHHALGSALAQGGRFADAGAILSRAVALRPDSAGAHAALGGAYDRQNLHGQAIEAYRRAVELKPDLGPVHHRLGELYSLRSRPEEAAHHLDRAADIDPNTTQARLYRSDAQLLRGDLAGAERWAREAVALEATSSAALGTLGGLLYAQGRFDEAAKCFEESLRLEPRTAKCWDGLVHCRKFTQADTSIVEAMRAVLRRADLGDVARMTIHFAIGKVHDDRGDYAHAMEEFDAANRLRARDRTFDRAGFAALVERNIEVFTHDVITCAAASGTDDQTPLFIVGMYRSGTTLTEQIVSSHPDIAAGGELTVWTPTDMEADPATGLFDPDRARPAVAKYLAALHEIGPSAARVTDKLPFNFLRLGAIHSMMPRARIIHCRRDPIDTCLSIYSTLFNSKMSFAARKDDLVFCYRQYLRMMDHWRKVLPAGVLLDVEYERLIEDRDAQTRRLIAFTGLGWNDLCLAPQHNSRSISTSSAWQVRQPVYATSMHRWRCYEPWLGELRELLSDVARS
jgi:tetratricopeptide (TPR) repeat protein